MFGKTFRTIMIMLLQILELQLTLGLPEIIVFVIVAIILGFCIHFFWSSKKDIRIEDAAAEGISENDNWKLKYYNDMDMQERAQQQLRERLAEARENEQILNIEVEEIKKELTVAKYRTASIHTEREHSDEPVAGKQFTTGASDYLSQLKSAQEDFAEHNKQIMRLLEQIDLLKEFEKKYLDTLKTNSQLNDQLSDIRRSVSEKENEINHMRHQQRLTEEMASRLDKAYSEFNLLQDKLQKIDSHVVQSRSRSDYEELQLSYFKLTKDLDELKSRDSSLWEENQRLSRILADTEDKLKESNFQRQQLQKKVNFLDELNGDLQQVSEHNKKLESQLKRIAEMETLLTKSNPEKNGFHSEPGQV
jgi:DNA repair exonuclease SbcCD ATPase subunit